MSNKVTMTIAALCVGVIAGWLICSNVAHAPQRGASLPICEQANVAQVSRLADEPTHQPRKSGDLRHVMPRSAEDESSDSEDDMEERMERRGIIMQQSAEEVRQAIIDNAELDDTQIEQLDSAIADMNCQMLEVSTKWADAIRETGTLDMDMRLRIQHDINGVSVAFSDKMDAEFPGWRDENTDLTRLVRVTTAFEPFRKIRSEILRGEMNAKNTEATEIDTEGDE